MAEPPKGEAGLDALKSISSLKRSEEVRQQLERAIRDGAFAPGARLPSERTLVATFGVSRVSVREAIRGLVGLGLVRVQQGRGAFVADRRSGIGEPMARRIDTHRDELLELHAVRGALDELAAALAATEAHGPSLEAIESAHSAFEQAAEARAAFEQLVGLDIDFHISIAEASGNRLLFDLLTDLHVYLMESRRLVSTSGRLDPSAGHARIVDAIRARDPEAARKAAARHVEAVSSAVAADLADEAARG
jgi:GntR family transcriptional repressor for pyruvate dehydrogenase complex